MTLLIPYGGSAAKSAAGEPVDGSLARWGQRRVGRGIARFGGFRAVELLATYRDIGLDAADAGIMALAERLGQTTIATLDHRDFRVVRPVHCDTLELVP